MSPKRFPYRLTVLLQLANDKPGIFQGGEEIKRKGVGRCVGLPWTSGFFGGLLTALSLSINYLKYALAVSILLFHFIPIETAFLFYIVQNVFVRQYFYNESPCHPKTVTTQTL